MEEEGTLVRPDNLKPAGKPMYMLYSKGLVRDEGTMLLAGFGVAICGDKDDLLFDDKQPIHNSAITLLEAELIALKYGLTEAVSLGIKHISICCDHDQIFELVMERSKPDQENIALLMRDVQDIRKKLTSSIPILVTQNFAYKFAMEAISNEIVIDMPAGTETCTICLNENLNADQMFSVDKCGHEFCSGCVKRHIEVRLLEGSLIRCLQYRCTSMLTYGSCVNILTPKLKEMWEQRIKEDSIPVRRRVYCQNPRCSALMSAAELPISTGLIKILCVKCGEPFCINCKAPWHDNMSCDRYKTHPNLTTNDRMLRDLAYRNQWRQCRECQHMIEHTGDECDSVICRCGHEFCYLCGVDAGLCYHRHGLPPIDWESLPPIDWESLPPIDWESLFQTERASPCCFSCCCFAFFLVIIAIFVVMLTLTFYKFLLQ